MIRVGQLDSGSTGERKDLAKGERLGYLVGFGSLGAWPMVGLSVKHGPTHVISLIPHVLSELFVLGLLANSSTN